MWQNILNVTAPGAKDLLYLSKQHRPVTHHGSFPPNDSHSSMPFNDRITVVLSHDEEQRLDYIKQKILGDHLE